MPVTPRRLGPALACAIACALLLPAMSAAATSAPDQRAPERYYMSFQTPDRTVEERYYASYGVPAQLTPAPSQVPSNDTSWLPVALSIAGALALVAASATQLRRVRIRRRRAARTPA
jgi:hypothetical protein